MILMLFCCKFTLKYVCANNYVNTRRYNKVTAILLCQHVQDTYR